MSPLPTVLLIPGAWHTPTCYTPLLTHLHSLGYPTATAALPSVGPSPGLSTWAADIASIISVLAPLVDAGKRVIVAAHSYGSLPAGEAIKKFLSCDREARGETGGVAHLVYISAFVLPAGAALMDALGGQDLPWFKVSDDKSNVYPVNPQEVFYNDLAAGEQERHSKALEPFSYAMFKQKTSWAPWERVAVSYVFCTLDGAIPLQVQRGMVQRAGGRWREVVLEAGHSPFLSRVGETAEAIVGAVRLDSRAG
ncbi:hypothetical protein G6514_002889 [Epicoccum nigrum]|nr:hypothetical protein G6514_002889 [Epicoccum nigrum]